MNINYTDLLFNRNYTTEQSIKDVVLYAYNLLPNDLIHNKQISINSFKFRPDYHFYFESKLYIIEFQGYQHYTTPEVQYRDDIKRKLCLKNNYIFIEIPYFIQLNNETFKIFFNRDTDYKFNFYPHGFINKQSKSFGEFNKKGRRLAADILFKLPKHIRKEIYQSLKFKSTYNKIDIQYYL